MKNLRAAALRYAPDLGMIAGAAAIVMGCYLIHEAAAWIVGGVLTIVGSVLSCADTGEKAGGSK